MFHVEHALAHTPREIDGPSASRGGVPVFSRPHSNPNDFSDSARSRDGGSPARLAGRCSRPTWIRPLRNVPVVMTSDCAGELAARPRAPRPTTRSVSTRIRPARPRIHSMPGLTLQCRAHPLAVAPLVGLGSRRPDRRTAAAVEHLELNAGCVDGPPHQPAKRVYLLDQMAFSGSADGRIAGHQRHGLACRACKAPPSSPSRAAAHAASTPACPAPTTMTSNFIIYLSIRMQSAYLTQVILLKLIANTVCRNCQVAEGQSPDAARDRCWSHREIARR